MFDRSINDRLINTDDRRLVKDSDYRDGQDPGEPDRPLPHPHRPGPREPLLRIKNLVGLLVGWSVSWLVGRSVVIPQRAGRYYSMLLSEHLL